MDFLLSILNWFSQNILQKPAFFVGILVLIGYILLKKPWYDVFAGFCCKVLNLLSNKVE